MDDPSCEPWDNGYQLASDVMALLERLRSGPLTVDRVRRSMLREEEIAGLLPRADQEAMERKMLEGLAGFLDSGGVSAEFGDAVAASSEHAEAFRLGLEWATVPAELRALCERRAETVMAKARTEGYVVGPDRADGECSITPAGAAFFDDGGYVMR